MVSRRPITANAPIRFLVSTCEILVESVAVRQVFLGVLQFSFSRYYQKDKRAKRRNLPNNNSISEIRKHYSLCAFYGSQNNHQLFP